jgi:hypothetical protein
VVGEGNDLWEPVLGFAFEADSTVGAGGVVHGVVHRHHVEGTFTGGGTMPVER